MALPLSAGAVTTSNFGTLANNVGYNAGNVNLSADDLFRWDGYVNGTASFTVNTYVDPLRTSALGGANILVGAIGSTLSAVTGSWGANPITFTKIGTTWAADLATIFTQSGLPGAQLLTITWTSANHNDQFSLNIGAIPEVPLPAAGGLLLVALAGLGLVGRARRSAAV